MNNKNVLPKTTVTASNRQTMSKDLGTNRHTEILQMLEETERQYAIYKQLNEMNENGMFAKALSRESHAQCYYPDGFRPWNLSNFSGETKEGTK